MINVLSIDWDYFMNCSSEDRLFMFPDGGNESIGLSLSSQIWSFCYASTKYRKEKGNLDKDILDIGIRHSEYSYVQKCIEENRKSNCIIQLSDSHLTIYNFLMEFSRCKKQGILNIYNLDHHSDCYNHGSELNCGNWVNRLDDLGYVNEYTWIYDDEPDDINLSCKSRATKDISIIKNIKWDYIFICRSSVWTPPHLDCYFNELNSFFHDSCGIVFNKNFFIDRYATIKNSIEQEYDFLKSSMFNVELDK